MICELLIRYDNKTGFWTTKMVKNIGCCASHRISDLGSKNGLGLEVWIKPARKKSVKKNKLKKTS